MSVDHEARFAAQPGPDGWAHLVRCSCGWSDVRSNDTDARASAEDHVRTKKLEAAA